MKKLILIDGNALIFRAYYATVTRMSRASNNTPTNALYLFATIVMKLIEKHDFQDIIVALDSPGKKIRHTEFDNYKANRKEVPDDLKQQFTPIKDFLNTINVKTIEIAGYEADDIIGSLSKKAQGYGFTVDIYTGDRDLLQLIDDNICICMMRKGLSEIECFDREHLKEVYNIIPSQIIDLKALMGDASDNIPGVKGIGEKTAQDLIEKYDTLSNLYDHLDEIKGKLKEKLENDKEMAYLSYKLATIDTNVFLDIDLNNLCYEGYDKVLLNKFFKQYSIRSLLRYTEEEDSVASLDIKVEIVNKVSKELLHENTFIFVDIDNENYHYAILRGIGLANENKCEYITGDLINFDFDLYDFLVNANIKKSVYDIKRSVISLRKIGIDIKGIDFDILLASYLLNQEIVNLPTGLFLEYGYDIKPLSKVVTLDDYANYSGSIAKISHLIKDKILAKIEKIDNSDLLFDVENPLALILASMEEKGVLIDDNLLNELEKDYSIKVKELENKVKELLEEPNLNINSTQQLAVVLYDKLKLPCNKKHSTSADDLKKIIDTHPAISYILEYRRYSKMLSAYIDAFKTYKFDDNRIHALFNQSITATGRLSSSSPNLQNLSVRDDSRMIIRKLIIAPKGYKILSIDYSQIELRILAILSNDETMLEAFKNNIDIHNVTAAKIYDIDVSSVSKEQRRIAKAVNFGIVYGLSTWGLAEQLKIDLKESQAIIDKFWQTYPKVKLFLEKCIENCKEQGYVTTLLKRRRIVPEINSSNYNVREYGKRIAMNTPIQGSAADIIKMAMLSVNEYLVKEKVEASLVCQIHDELIFEVKEEKCNEIALKLKEIMENVLANNIKLEVNYNIGDNWLDAK